MVALLTIGIGLVSAAEFKKAIEEAGLQYGSKEMDKIFRLIAITQDGKANYSKLADHVDNLVR